MKKQKCGRDWPIFKDEMDVQQDRYRLLGLRRLY